MMVFTFDFTFFKIEPRRYFPAPKLGPLCTAVLTLFGASEAPNDGDLLAALDSKRAGFVKLL